MAADLNPNEWEALRVLWEQGESKPSAIQEQFGWNIDNGTLRSVLRVLMEKGHVSRRKDGKAYLYKAKRTRKGVMRDMARHMADVFAHGSTAGLIAELIKTEKLSPSDLTELKRIAQSETKSNVGKRRKG